MRSEEYYKECSFKQQEESQRGIGKRQVIKERMTVMLALEKKEAASSEDRRKEERQRKGT